MWILLPWHIGLQTLSIYEYVQKQDWTWKRQKKSYNCVFSMFAYCLSTFLPIIQWFLIIELMFNTHLSLYVTKLRCLLKIWPKWNPKKNPLLLIWPLCTISICYIQEMDSLPLWILELPARYLFNRMGAE